MQKPDNKNITNNQKMNVITQGESIQLNEDIMNKQMTEGSTDIRGKHLEMHRTLHPSNNLSAESDTSIGNKI